MDIKRELRAMKLREIQALNRVKRLFRFKYPKLMLLVAISIIAYYLFSNPFIQELISSLDKLSYVGILIAGIFFSFGFSTPLAIGFFLLARPENIYIASLIGGFGALLADLFIFKMIKFSFMDEFIELEHTRPIRMLNRLFSISILHRIKNYLLYAFAGLVIASPLPDELGVSMLAGLTKINIRLLALISFVMNTIGIFAMIYIGNSI